MKTDLKQIISETIATVKINPAMSNKEKEWTTLHLGYILEKHDREIKYLSQHIQSEITFLEGLIGTAFVPNIKIKARIETLKKQLKP